MDDPDGRPPGVAPDGGVRGYEPSFVDVDGVRTRYYDVGRGDPLVLAHGGIWGDVFSANGWAPTFEHLTEAFRVVAFDRLGCGLTDGPRDVERFDWEAEFEHARAFLSALRLDGYHLGGSSRGAGLAAALALEAPDRVGSLVLLNSATFGPWAGDRSFVDDRVFERYTPALDPTDPAYARMRYELYSYRTDHVTDEYCETAAWMCGRPASRETVRRLDAAGRREAYESTKREAMRTAHARIEADGLPMPVLYCFGRNDLTVDLQTGLAAFDLIGQHNPDVRLHLVNHCGHLVHREVPREFARIVAGFVDATA